MGDFAPQNVFRFGKKRISALATPERGKRAIYRDSETPHLCLRVTPTARTFFWEKTVARKQRRVTIGKFPGINAEQARDKAKDISADYVKGIDVAGAKRAKGDEMTLADLWQDFKANRKRKIPGKESTALNYQWKKYFEDWGSKQLSEITYESARRLILGIRRHAPFHANRIQRQGKSMFNHAITELRWSGENPFSFAQVSEKGRERKIRLQPADMKKFMGGLEACSDGMRLLFLSSLYTGRRMGEVQSMRWVDLDLESCVWTLPNTKAGESQQAVLPVALIEMLSNSQKKSVSPWVFPSPSKSGHVEQIKKAWDQVRKASGLHHVQARDLRRTLASWAQDVSMPMAAVQAQLGHADISTTAKHYTSINVDVLRAALNETVNSMVEAGR